MFIWDTTIRNFDLTFLDYCISFMLQSESLNFPYCDLKSTNHQKLSKSKQGLFKWIREEYELLVCQHCLPKFEAKGCFNLQRKIESSFRLVARIRLFVNILLESQKGRTIGTLFLHYLALPKVLVPYFTRISRKTREAKMRGRKIEKMDKAERTLEM